jgi:hypothetical protein
MAYELTFHERPTWLHAIVTGPNTRTNVELYLDQLFRECASRGCKRVLVEERLTGPRLPIHEIFDIISYGSQQAAGKFMAIAFVDVNSAGDLMKFAETVAFNRAVPLRLFGTVAEAEAWLASAEEG